MFRFKAEHFNSFYCLFIYKIKQKSTERKRTVLEIFPYHHYTGLGLIYL